LIEINIHQISGGKVFGLTSLIISGLGYRAKVDTLNSLFDMVRIGDDVKHNTAMKNIIADFDKYSSIRNAIAHNTWVNGRRKNSVKPLNISIRGGKAKIKGVRTNEKEYTIKELIVIEKALKDRHDALGHLVLSISSRKLENSGASRAAGE
jgi:hypothetical protein